ncbi:hypothetical protein V8G54_030245 [Vigna mungo]|uniref:Uncharacterized protein n=1 Tax=Vigna mungo TaxID=3915 RepID=A0AAQ3MUU5_VIGMU
MTQHESWSQVQKFPPPHKQNHQIKQKGDHNKQQFLTRTANFTWECRAIALPLSWLKRFLPTMFRVTTTRGAKIPFPSLTFFIIGCNLTGFPLPTRTCDGTDLANKV